MSSDILTRKEKLFRLFAAYGHAMLTAHGLELRLATLLSVRVVLDGGTEDDQNKALARIEQQPMGGLIRNFITSYNPPEEIVEELDNVLYFRNELAHRISRIMLLAASTDDWELSLIQKLEEMTEMFVKTEQILEPFMAEYRNKVGVPEETLESLGRRLYPGITNAA